jgi:hypothetical protein
MTPEDSLARGKAFLDEATENMTFDEFHWELEESCRGVAWVLNALVDSPRKALGLVPKGELPRSGALVELRSAAARPPSSARVVDRLVGLLRTLGASDDLDAAIDARSDEIAELVFASWELHDDVGQRIGLVDERLGDKLLLADVSPGRLGSPIVERRTALKILAAGSILPLAVCKKIEQDNRQKQPVENDEKTTPSQIQPARSGAVTPLGGMHWKTTDPFLFCAHHVDEYPEGNADLGPDASLAGRHLGRDFEGKDNWRMYHGKQVPGFPRHPHRGFETVTVVRSGMLDHSDSMGATARYGGGDVQWLTAGGGIQHAEMFPLLRSDAPNPLELFQIWLNLPASDKMVDPHFKMLWREQIPRITEKDASGRIVQLNLAAGAFRGAGPPAPPPNSWASRKSAEVAIWSVRMEAGATFELPAVSEGVERSLYLHSGRGIRVGQRDVPNARRVEVDGPGPLALEAGAGEAEFVLLQGRPIDEPVAKRGPFVMNSQREIREAYADYRRTQFGGWPWPANGPVHSGGKGRFARHIDGTYEEPT